MKSKAWRLYSDFLKCKTREEAEEVLARAAGFGMDHVLRLAPHFAREHGRLPDEYHNMVVLTGGDLAKRYLSGLEGEAKVP